MKKFFLKTFASVSNFLFWVWVWVGTPFCIYGILFFYAALMTGKDHYPELFFPTLGEIMVKYVLIFAVFFFLRKFAKKSLNVHTDSAKDNFRIFFFVSNYLFWLWIILCTPFWTYNIFFDYTFYMTGSDISPTSFAKSTITVILIYFFIFILFWSLKRLTKKLLKIHPQ